MANDEIYTPDFIIELARQDLGFIDLDPATSIIANKTVQANYIFTIEDNGLDKDWTPYKSIWMNPPYSQPKCRLFCEKLIDYATNTGNPAIAIINNSSGVHYHNMMKSADYTLFHYGRISWIHPTSDEITNKWSKGANRHWQSLFFFNCKPNNNWKGTVMISG